MVSRTQIVCLCEGKKGQSIDAVFINRLMKSLQPDWLRPWPGSNMIRLVPCGGRKELVERMPKELKDCLAAGGHTTLMVWADCDDDDLEALNTQFRNEAKRQSIADEQFERVVFIFAKDRLENWIEFLKTGKTDESKEGPRVKHPLEASDAAKALAKMCRRNESVSNMPPSLRWSCKNWQDLKQRIMKG